MSGSLKNLNIIKFNNKVTSSEEFDYIHKIFLDGTSDIIDYLLQTGKYVTINKNDKNTMIYYVIKYASNTFILK